MAFYYISYIYYIYYLLGHYYKNIIKLIYIHKI